MFKDKQGAENITSLMSNAIEALTGITYTTPIRLEYRMQYYFL